MSAQDPFASNVPPERPANPTHFGGAGLYDASAAAGDVSSDVSETEHFDSESTTGSMQGEQRSQDSSSQGSLGALREFAKRNRVVPALLAIGGIGWLVTTLVRRSMQR